MSESSTWLRLVRGQTGPCLYHSNGFKQILDGMHSPTTKYPSLALMLGGKRKNSALKELLAQNKVQTKLDSNLNIRIDNRTLHSTFPVLVADCDPHMCHLDVLRPDLPALPITWATSDDRDISDIILSQLIFLFTDVICIFAADAGGLEGVLTLLTTWALYGPGSTLPLRPHVLVVIESGVSRVSDDLRERDFLEGLFKQSGVSGTYASVHILTLPGATVAISTRLRDGILRRLDIARHERSEHRLLFSAAHFNRMFDLAVNHRCQSKMVRFDFIRASRVGNDVGTEYAAHLARFFMLLEGHLEDSQASFLASSMLMDAYPPNMHGNVSSWSCISVLTSLLVFDPVSVFRTLYQGPCLQALGMTIKDSIELYKRCHLVESHFARLFEQFDCALKPTRFIHKETLNQAGTWLTGAQSNNLCLCCLRRRPQHHFSCHAICDVCVEIFGRPVDGSESQYSFERCLVCKHPQAIHVNLLPKTATVRALAIDGGGVRVVIPLQILILLQDLLAGHLTVKDLFDVAMGSSSGTWTLSIFRGPELTCSRM